MGGDVVSVSYFGNDKHNQSQMQQQQQQQSTATGASCWPQLPPYSAPP